MPILKWDGKDKIENTKPLFNDHSQFITNEILISQPDKDSKFYENEEKKPYNLLILGDNKRVMETLLKEYSNKIDLIYIDPPFATGGSFPLKLNIGNEGDSVVVTSYSDIWNGGIDSYLNFLYERLILMKELLSDTGSIYVHLDWHVSHYVKVILDEIFGLNNFRNEIIWMYPAASARTRKFFIRSYDTILYYTKSDNYVFNDDPHIYMEYSKRVKNALKEDEKGKFYYRGGSHNGKKLSRKVYVKNDGIFPRDIWNDIPYIRANTVEYQGFATQKPERLLKRIILASTNKDQLIADFFCGSGTTLAVAEKLGRKWIGCDSMIHSINICRKRILSIRESYDLYSWKKEYKLPANTLKIITQINTRPEELEDLFVSNQENPLSPGEPDFTCKVIKDANYTVINLIDYQIPYLKRVKSNVRNKIKSSLDWIDYWAVDFEFDEKVFCPDWWSYRTPRERNLQSKSKKHFYKKNAKYKIAVKVINIFGTESIKIYDLKI